MINPSVEESEKSDIHLTVAGTKDAINMVEAGAKEVSEEEMIDALMFGHDHIKMLCEFQEQIIAKCAKPKMEIKLDVVPEEIKAEIDELAKARLIEAVSIKLKLERYGKIDEITDEMAALFEAREYASEKLKDKTVKQVRAYCTEIVANEVRR